MGVFVDEPFEGIMALAAHTGFTAAQLHGREAPEVVGRLRREGLLDYDWRESDAGPPRKYYRLTDAGRAALTELRGYWQHLTHTLDTLGR